METIEPIQAFWSSGAALGVILGAVIASVICYFAEGDEKIEILPNSHKVQNHGESEIIPGITG